MLRAHGLDCRESLANTPAGTWPAPCRVMTTSFPTRLALGRGSTLEFWIRDFEIQALGIKVCIYIQSFLWHLKHRNRTYHGVIWSPKVLKWISLSIRSGVCWLDLDGVGTWGPVYL